MTPIWPFVFLLMGATSLHSSCTRPSIHQMHSLFYRGFRLLFFHLSCTNCGFSWVFSGIPFTRSQPMVSCRTGVGLSPPDVHFSYDIIIKLIQLPVPDEKTLLIQRGKETKLVCCDSCSQVKHELNLLGKGPNILLPHPAASLDLY